jgi:CheY-like chemotaxis protein
MLKRLGCKVEIADNGCDAIAMVLARDYDLIFMDCQMPEMDGYSATQAIRSLELAEDADSTQRSSP